MEEWGQRCFLALVASRRKSISQRDTKPRRNAFGFFASHDHDRSSFHTIPYIAAFMVVVAHAVLRLKGRRLLRDSSRRAGPCQGYFICEALV